MNATKAAVIRWLIKLAALMPLRVTHGVGYLFAMLIVLFRLSPYRTTRINVDLCFPELSAAQRRTLVQESLVETCRTFLEIPAIWERDPLAVLKLIRNIENESLLQDYHQAGKGMIVLVPHLGNWELVGLYLSSLFGMAALYRPPKLPELDDYIAGVRGRLGSELVPTTSRGVLRLFSILREGGVVGILPDQEPPFSGGEFAPFFGVEANTMKLVSKMLAKTEARVLVAYARRLPEAQGFDIVVSEPDNEIYDEQLLNSISAMNRSIEDCVRQAPSQYQWEYKRFKRRRPGQPHFYDKGRVW